MLILRKGGPLGRRSMSEETLSFWEIIRQNLEKNGTHAQRLEEMRLGLLFDAAELMLSRLAPNEGALDLSPLFAEASLLAELPLEGKRSARAFLPENRAFLSFFGDAISSLDRIGFAECFLLVLEERLGRPVTLGDLPEGVGEKPREKRVLYVKNAYADLAFDGFAPLLPMARPLTRQSFRAVCDDLENELGDYAILPLFSEGKEIFSVSSLLFEYGFSITALICPETKEEEPPIFALLARTPLLLGDARFFSFCFFPKRGEDTTALLSAIDCFSLSLQSMETLPTASVPGYRVTVRGDDRKFVFLLTYLTLFVKDFSSFGFYGEVKKGKRNL